MIFPRNPKGPALPSEKKRLPTLPGSSSVCQWLYVLPCLFHSCPRHSHFHRAWETKRAARKDSSVLYGFTGICMVSPFHGLMLSEN